MFVDNSKLLQDIKYDKQYLKRKQFGNLPIEETGQGERRHSLPSVLEVTEEEIRKSQEKILQVLESWEPSAVIAAITPQKRAQRVFKEKLKEVVASQEKLSVETLLQEASGDEKNGVANLRTYLGI